MKGLIMAPIGNLGFNKDLLIRLTAMLLSAMVIILCLWCCIICFWLLVRIYFLLNNCLAMYEIIFINLSSAFLMIFLRRAPLASRRLISWPRYCFIILSISTALCFTNDLEVNITRPFIQKCFMLQLCDVYVTVTNWRVSSSKRGHSSDDIIY